MADTSTNTSPPTPTDCEKCPALCENRSQIVNGVGPESTDVLIVGEAPGEQEDKTGKPFVGRSGDVLTQTMNRHGIKRNDVRIVNTVRCRPPDNRDPTVLEQDNCEPYLLEEITAVNPDVIVPVGKVPAQRLLGESVSITSMNGELTQITIDEIEYDVLPCLHPAATLYDPSTKDAFEETIRTVASMTGKSPSSQTTFTEFNSGNSSD